LRTARRQAQAGALEIGDRVITANLYVVGKPQSKDPPHLQLRNARAGRNIRSTRRKEPSRCA